MSRVSLARAPSPTVPAGGAAASASGAAGDKGNGGSRNAFASALADSQGSGDSGGAAPSTLSQANKPVATALDVTSDLSVAAPQAAAQPADAAAPAIGPDLLPAMADMEAEADPDPDVAPSLADPAALPITVPAAPAAITRDSVQPQPAALSAALVGRYGLDDSAPIAKSAAKPAIGSPNAALPAPSAATAAQTDLPAVSTQQDMTASADAGMASQAGQPGIASAVAAPVPAKTQPAPVKAGALLPRNAAVAKPLSALPAAQDGGGVTMQVARAALGDMGMGPPATQDAAAVSMAAQAGIATNAPAATDDSKAAKTQKKTKAAGDDGVADAAAQTAALQAAQSMGGQAVSNQAAIMQNLAGHGGGGHDAAVPAGKHAAKEVGAAEGVSAGEAAAPSSDAAPQIAVQGAAGNSAADDRDAGSGQAGTAGDGSLAGMVALPGAPQAASFDHMVSKAAGPDAAGPARSPTDQVAVKVASAVKAGNHTMTVEMRPEALGRVEIKLDFRADNTVSVQLTVDRHETFAALHGNRAGLEQQLSQAGVDLGGGSLDLRFSQNQNQQQQSQGNLGGSRVVAQIEDLDADTTAETSLRPDTRRAGNTLIDINA